MIALAGLLDQTTPTTAPAGGCSILPGGVGVSGNCTAANSLHISVAYRSIIPVLVLSVGALLILAVSAVLSKRSRPGLYAGLTVVVGGASLAGSVWEWFDLGSPHAAQIAIGGQVFYDRYSVLFMILISIAVMLSGAATDSYLRREGLDGVEAYVLILMSATGAMLMAQAASLIMLFLGLEIMSIALYVMAAYHRRRARSGEAGLKYFILGSFSSALFLYGVALVYGATGTTEMKQMAYFLSQNLLVNNGVLLAGMVLLIVGLGFKVAAVPFHFWTPDVYEGSPTPFTGYMAAVAKAAGFAGLLRVLVSALPTQQTDWRPIIWVLAVLTLLVGSVLAIASRDVKRMLAYSSVSQAGYVLVGLQAASRTGTAGALFYLFTYTFIIIGSFVVVEMIQGPGEARNDIGAMRGLGRRQPLVAGAMLILLLAQAGVPFTSGFLAKFYVIQASVGRGQYYLAVIAMLAAAAAAFFYLRLALLMYAGPSGARPSMLAAADPSTEPPAGAASVPAEAYSGAVADRYDEAVFTAGLAPVATLDPPSSAELIPPSEEPIHIPAASAAVLALCVAFTIAAGVSSFALDFAKAAVSYF